MASTDAAQPRKARPPTSIGPVVATADRQLRFTALYESGNGVPVHAIVLPMRMIQGQWTLINADGDPVRRPGGGDIMAPTATVTPIAPGTEPAVTVQAAWPQDASHALVLLLHSQVADAGDTGRFLLKVLKFDMHPLSAALSDEAEPARVAPVQENPTRRELIRDAAAAYLNEPLRSDAGVLAKPFFPAAVMAAAMAPVASLHDAMAATSDRQPPPPTADSVPRKLCFALASCQYPAGIVDGSFQRPGLHDKADTDIAPADHNLWRLARRFEQDDSLAFTVLAGDQVYVDATAGLFDARSLLDALNFSYERVRASQGMDRLTRFGRGGMVALMDDHELSDNWQPLPDAHPLKTDADDGDLEQARDAFMSRQRNFWWPYQPSLPQGKTLSGERRLGGFPFFLTDTRTEREGRWAGNWSSTHIIGAGQRDALHDWIIRLGTGPSVTPAFIVSPSILLPRPLQLRDQPAMALHVDAWCGYPRSLHALLAWAFDANASHLVFLSGDEHLACLARITLRRDDVPDRTVTLHSVHTGALYAPYPFANAIREDFADDGDVFRFSHADGHGLLRQYSCTVNTFFPGNGDGFTLIQVERDTSGWSLRVEFDGQDGMQARTHRL